uniref:Sushi domain-containing protein n=1 Tax=Astyanax mexicanus TaxID=7994 RepID=A0A3B1IQA8_ASTMX
LTLIHMWIYIFKLVFCNSFAEPTCATPRDEHVVSPFLLGWFSRLGRSGPYQCEPGYKATADRAECTENGWSPKPLCKGTLLDCGPPPLISDAVQELKEEYKNGEIATYECPANYVKSGDPHLTCIQGSWTGNGECLRKYRSLIVLLVYKYDKVCYKNTILCCVYGFRQQCINGKIDLPSCG